MGLAGLTAVFGMGTGVAPPVWSPRIRPTGGYAQSAAQVAAVVTGQGAQGAWRGDAHSHSSTWTLCRIEDRPAVSGGELSGLLENNLSDCTGSPPQRFPSPLWGEGVKGTATVSSTYQSSRFVSCRPGLNPPRSLLAVGASGSGWSSDRLLGPVRCGGRPPCTPGPSTWSSSRSLRRHATGNLVLEGASRLDAFSAYPVPTWLPGDAPSGTAGTPEVGPPQSSRTRGDAPQVSYAHGR